MKWEKALNVLIGIFLIVNVVLGAGNYMKHVKAYRVSEERMTTIKSILNDRGIVFECDLPESFKPVKTLWLEPLEIDSQTRDGLVKRLFGKNNERMTISKKSSDEPYEEMALVYSDQSEEIVFQGNTIIYRNHTLQKDNAKLKKEQALSMAKKFVNRLEIKENFKKIKIDYRSESYGGVVTYYEVCNKLPIFDSYIRMEVTPSGVVYAEVKGATIADKVGTTKPLDPIDKVLFDIDEQISQPTPLTIENVELGYSMKNNEGMHILDEEAVPVYKIDIKGLSEPIFVNAYTK